MERNRPDDKIIKRRTNSFLLFTLSENNSRSLKAQLVIDSSYTIFLALHLDGAFAPDLSIFRVRDKPYQKPGDNNPSTRHAK